MIFTDGNYGYYHIKVPFFHIDAMNIYLDLGNNAKFFEHLKNAAAHSIKFDNLTPGTPYTSPLNNKINHGSIIKNYKGNEAYNLLKKLDDEKYNIIRDTPEFIEICENLKQHVKEDE